MIFSARDISSSPYTKGIFVYRSTIVWLMMHRGLPGHWYLAIVHEPGRMLGLSAGDTTGDTRPSSTDTRRDTEAPSDKHTYIITLDSLGNRHSRVAEVIGAYLESEAAEKKLLKEHVLSPWKYKAANVFTLPGDVRRHNSYINRYHSSQITSTVVYMSCTMCGSSCATIKGSSQASW